MGVFLVLVGIYDFWRETAPLFYKHGFSLPLAGHQQVVGFLILLSFERRPMSQHCATTMCLPGSPRHMNLKSRGASRH